MSGKQITLSVLKQMKSAGDKIACLTAYDASFAAIVEQAGVEVILVGDSLGMVLQGRESTLPVTVDDMVYHTQCVRRGSRGALVVADMPFMSYASPEQAVASAGRLMKEGGAHMVKLEGGAAVVESVARITAQGIPVCAHLGLLPQSVHKLGGYKVQGRDEDSATRIQRDALALQAAGADMLVVECIPQALTAELTKMLSIPVIGIGAGVDCDGQVLVLYDMLGITLGKTPKFSHNFLADAAGDIGAAVQRYVDAVKSARFPTQEHSFT